MISTERIAQPASRIPHNAVSELSDSSYTNGGCGCCCGGEANHRGTTVSRPDSNHSLSAGARPRLSAGDVQPASASGTPLAVSVHQAYAYMSAHTHFRNGFQNAPRSTAPRPTARPKRFREPGKAGDVRATATSSLSLLARDRQCAILSAAAAMQLPSTSSFFRSQ